MPLNIGWGEIALRLALTVFAGILIGINRSEHGHAAGLRTTLLVCLAASLSMLQVNLLLPMAGKTSSSFAVMDLMRLPLGILSGMGFYRRWRNRAQRQFGARLDHRCYSLVCYQFRIVFRSRATRTRYGRVGLGYPGAPRS